MALLASAFSTRTDSKPLKAQVPVSAFSPRLDILPPAQQRLWPELKAIPRQFILYGGTAIALRLGHRQSVDFDFFSSQTFEPEALFEVSPMLRNARRLQSRSNTLSVEVDRGGSGELSFSGGLTLGRVGGPDQVEGHSVRVASMLDLAGMKAAVIQERCGFPSSFDTCYPLLLDRRARLICPLQGANEPMNCVSILALWPKRIGAAVAVAFLVHDIAAQPNPVSRNYAVEISATVQASPPAIALRWLSDPWAASYVVSRRTSTSNSWSQLAQLGGNATTFTDTTVASAIPYEYQILKQTSADPPYLGTGCIYSGINVPLIEQRGKVILVVANTYAEELAPELARLQQDLVGDGWAVIRHDVSPDDSVSSVKATIVADYKNDPTQVRALFLFGHVPVAYSGDINPDGHPNHQGAWPADVYYADMHGNWTDSLVTSTNAERDVNWNVPGDGKFDQSEPPGNVDLEMGRVDLSNLTSFSNKTPPRYEKDLLRQYLNKDHAFRHRLFTIEQRGLIVDLAGIKDEGPLADSGWRNFAPFFGTNTFELIDGNFITTLQSNGYLWSYAAGGGGYFSSDGIGSADDLATTDIKTVFTMMIGSYFGDWDNESNFLRSMLGPTSYTLTSSYAGYPHNFYHHMALGETIGFSMRLTQNNTTNGPYLPALMGTHQVHISLMGDPTLRLHPVLPPTNLIGSVDGSGVALSWNPSVDSGIIGYHVYRGSSPDGPFSRLTLSDPIPGTTYLDKTGNNSLTYMVRAIKLEHSPSGTYYNPSQGIFFSDGLGTNVTVGAAFVNGSLQVQISGAVSKVFALETSSDLMQWTPILTNQIPSGGFTYREVPTIAGARRFYRARMTP